MCTVTFIPRDDRFHVSMNRDERIERPLAKSPAVYEQGLVQSIYPLDSAGGTWIAANSERIALALLNWNDAQVVRQKTRSRGAVIRALINSHCSEGAEAALRRIDLEGILPFRLVGIFPTEESLFEWHWDQNSIGRKTFPWIPRQWCSSSLSDAAAASVRRKTFERKLTEGNAGSLTWLRQLHSSHDDDHPPLSHCVHREKVETVSYTELVCSTQAIECHYIAGSPCRADHAIHRVSLAG